jgi:hypothetical protein
MSVTTELMALGLPGAVSTKITDSFVESGAANTFTGAQTFGDGVLTDTVGEETAAAGVTIDGVLVKDGGVTLAAATALLTDTISEVTAANGVVIDSTTLKDGGIIFGTGGVFDADSGTVTLSSHAGTVSKMAGVITTESLTTAAGASQALTITNTLCATTSIVLVTRAGGTSAGGTPIIKAVPGNGSFVITLDNKHASAAFDGTFILGFLLIKA